MLDLIRQRARMKAASVAWLSAAEIARRVGAGDLDPQEVVRTHLDAIDQLDPRLHAYVHVDRGARASTGPLAGVTVAVKDNLPVAGMPWTDGSAVWRDRVPTEDTVPVARARKAGAAILGKTNLPELAAAVGTTNAIFPATNNPWRAGITPGGSSGGSAAAVAAGMATVAMGTDMGGSIRIPASCCGVVGLRPSPDRVPSESVDPAGLSVIAPLGRTVADVRLLFSVMANAPAPQPPAVPKGFRIGVAETTALGMDDACAGACRRARDAPSRPAIALRASLGNRSRWRRATESCGGRAWRPFQPTRSCSPQASASSSSRGARCQRSTTSRLSIRHRFGVPNRRQTIAVRVRLPAHPDPRPGPHADRGGAAIPQRAVRALHPVRAAGQLRAYARGVGSRRPARGIARRSAAGGDAPARSGSCSNWPSSSRPCPASASSARMTSLSGAKRRMYD